MPARRLVWSRSTQSSVAVTNAQYDLLTDFRTAGQYGAQPLGTTITRVRGAIVLIPSAPTPTGIVVGMVVEDRAAPAGQVPLPIDERHVDWMAWQPIPSVGRDGVTGSATSYEFDFRAQRKLDEVGQTLWMSWQEAVTSVTVTWNVTVFLSVLLKLP